MLGTEMKKLCYGNCSCGCYLVIQLCLTLATPWTVAHQAPLSMGLPRQGILEWVAVSCPRDLPDKGSNARLLPWQERSLPLSRHLCYGRCLLNPESKQGEILKLANEKYLVSTYLSSMSQAVFSRECC